MNKRISKRIVWSTVAGLGVLAIVAAVFLLAGPTAYAAQVGGISVSEEELETEIKSCVMLGKTAADLHELTYAVASVKVMREQIQGTEYDLPEGYEKEIRKESREKANDDSAETAEYLKKYNLTRDDFADIGMLQLCGRGIAMGNAIDEVKQKADFVIGGNDEEGIAEYLQQFL